MEQTKQQSIDIVDAGEWSGDMRVNMSTIMGAGRTLARLLEESEATNAELLAEIKELKGIQNALAYLYTGYSGETMDDAVKEAKQYIVDDPDF